MIDELGRDARIGEVLLDLRRVLLIHLLRGSAPNAVEACDSTPAPSNAILHRRIEAGRTRHPISLCYNEGNSEEVRNGGMDVMSGTPGAVCDLA